MREKGQAMSSAMPRWTPEMLDEYRKRMAGLRPQKPEKAAATPKATPRAHTREKSATGPSVAATRPMTPYSPSESVAVPLRAAGGKMTQTESRYNRDVLGGKGRFEAVALKLPGGGRYTPDFMTIDDGQVTFHEVKGSYRLGSQGRAFTAFHDAAAYYPMWRFVWAHWTGREWERKTF